MTTLLDNVDVKYCAYIIVYGDRYILKDIYMSDRMRMYTVWRRDIDRWCDYDYMVTLDDRVIARTSLEIADFVDYYEHLEDY